MSPGVRWGPTLLAAVVLGGCVGGCVREPGLVAATRSRTRATKAKPLDARAYYARMAEINHASDVLAAAELRRFRRVAEHAPISARQRQTFASYAALCALDHRVESELKALGTPPNGLRALYGLRLAEVRRSQAVTRTPRRLIERGDRRGFLAAVSRPDPLRVPEERRIAAEDRRVRHRLGLGPSTASSLAEATPLAIAPPPRPEPVSRGRRFRPKSADPRLSPGDRAFVAYARAMQTTMVASNARMDALAADLKANLPRGRAARAEYLGSRLDEMRALDLRTLEELRRLGPPPVAARAWTRALVRQSRYSADALAGIHSRARSVAERAELLARFFGGSSDPYREDARREAVEVFDRLAAIARRSGG